MVTGSDFATSVKVRLTVTPGTVGPEPVRRAWSPTTTPAGRSTPTSVRLRFSLPGNPDIGRRSSTCKERPGGRWTASSTVLSIFGTWSVDVVVQQPSGGVEVPLELTPRSCPTQDITTQAIPGQPTVYSIALPGGSQLQTYVDPGKSGTNAVHFTFFDAAGNEMLDPSATRRPPR